MSSADRPVDLLELARLGNREAFVELCQQVQVTLAVQAKWITRNEEDAREAVQRTFVKGFLNLSKCTAGTAAGFHGWLRTINRRNAIDVLRESRRFWSLFVLDEPDETRIRDRNNRADESSTIISQAEAEEIRQAVEALSDQQRLVITLVFYEGCNNAEIADLLGVSKDAVYSARSKGLEILRRRLGGSV